MTETKKKRPAAKAAKPKQGDEPAMQKNTQSDIVVTEATIADLIPDDKNLNKGTQFGQHLIEKSLRELGAGRSLLLDKNNRIIAGNKTTENAAAIDLNDVIIVESDGTKLVAVKRTDIDLDSERGRKLALADNATSAANLEWDEETIRTMQDELDNFNPEDWGVTFPEESEEEEEKQAKEDDFDETKDEVPTICQRGDIWLLGDHRLMCGDSTYAGDVALLMDGGKARLLLTDPPYGINVVSKDGTVGGGKLCATGVYSPVIGDETIETAEKSYKVGQQFTDKQIIFGGNYFTSFLPPSDGWLIWDKRGDSGIRNNFADGEMAWCSFHTPVRIYHQIWAGMIRQGEHEKRVHPTQKPVRMLSEIITDFSTVKDSILDLFGGSGTTMIAAEQLGRKCYMMELDPHYCDIIIARWEKLTNGKAQKIN